MNNSNLKYCSKCRKEHPIQWFDGRHNQTCRKWRWADNLLRSAIRRNKNENEVRQENKEDVLALTITTRDIINQWDEQDGLCCYTENFLGIPWMESHPMGNLFEPELDKIENDKGYIQGNIAISTKKFNLLKSDLSLEELFDVVNREAFSFVCAYDNVERLLNEKRFKENTSRRTLLINRSNKSAH